MFGAGLQKLLDKIREPDQAYEIRFKGNDLLIITNEKGQAVRLFIGKKKPEGRISGDRYSRTIIKTPSGEIIKDYWQRKGKAT